MSKSFKTRVRSLLIKAMCLNPKVEEDLGGCFFDSHHALYDLNMQNYIMTAVFSSNINENDLCLIDSMFVEEENIYKRLNKLDAMRFRMINKLLADIAKEGYSIKHYSFNYIDNLFGFLYENRQLSFNLICGNYPSLSFKTRKHFDEENDPMFDGCFLAGIYTPLGVVTFHFKLKYFDHFNAPEIERGPRYDNYDIQECLYRLASLEDEELVRKHLEKRNYKTLELVNSNLK